MSSNYRIAILTRYTKSGASSRIRFFDYEQRLVQAGYEIHYQALLPDSYIDSLCQTGRKSYSVIFWSYIKRFLWLVFNIRRFDFFWIEKELFPDAPTFLETFFLRAMKKVVLDYDDGIHLNYVGRGLGRDHKIQKLMAISDQVFAGSPHLEEIAKAIGAQNVVRVPTPVEVPENPKKPQLSDPFRIGWVGSPASEKYLLDIKECVVPEIAGRSIEWIFIGTKKSHWNHLNHVTCLDWSLEEQKRLLGSIDLGIMPLRDSEWEASKCSYKLLLYQAWGRPVLASPIGMNREVVIDQKTGYLVLGTWQQEFIRVLNTPKEDLLKTGQQARAMVKHRYTYDKVFEVIQTQFDYWKTESP